MVLRLSPQVPMLWRSPTSLQLGVDPVRLVLDDVTSGQERLLATLSAGISPAGYAMVARSVGVGPLEAEALLTAVTPMLEPSPAASPPGAVQVLGAGPIATRLAELMARPEVPRDATPVLAVLVADWVITPADHGAWLRRDIPHLPIVLSESGAVVGPLVEPGLGPCLHCVHCAKQDADPAWPAIASQLWGRPAPALDPVAVGEIVAFASRRIRDRLAHGPGSLTSRDGAARGWRLDAGDGSISELSWTRHPACLCAAPQESGWALGADPADLPEPTRARVAAAHA